MTVFRNSLFGRKAFSNPVRNGRCSHFEIDNHVLSEFVLHCLVPVVGTSPFPLNELMLMTAAVCRLAPTHIFEWGTNIGKSARVFHETCKTFGILSEIHSIDLPDDVSHVEHPKEKRGMLVKGIRGVTLHLGDGLDRSLEIISTLSREEIRPLFFIDGDHSYQSVRRELEGIMKNVPEATVLLHDTFCQDERSGYNVGPWKAIADVLDEKPNGFNVLSQDMGLPGMTLLWR